MAFGIASMDVSVLCGYEAGVTVRRLAAEVNVAALLKELTKAGHVSETLRQERDDYKVELARERSIASNLTSDLAHWQTCSLCGERMDAPGLCQKGRDEERDGYQAMPRCDSCTFWTRDSDSEHTGL
jgi:hypothetical protein